MLRPMVIGEVGSTTIKSWGKIPNRGSTAVGGSASHKGHSLVQPSSTLGICIHFKISSNNPVDFFFHLPTKNTNGCLHFDNPHRPKEGAVSFYIVVIRWHVDFFFHKKFYSLPSPLNLSMSFFRISQKTK